MSRLTFAALRRLLAAAGVPAGWVPLVAAFAFAESGATPSEVQAGQPYATTGWGLWQITPGDSYPEIGTDDQLLTPALNARAAAAKFAAQGPTAWRNDKTWTAWKAAGAEPEPSVADVAGYVRTWATPTILALLTATNTTTPTTPEEIPEMKTGIVEYDGELWSVSVTGGIVKKVHLSGDQVTALQLLGAQRLDDETWAPLLPPLPTAT